MENMNSNKANETVDPFDYIEVTEIKTDDDMRHFIEDLDRRTLKANGDLAFLSKALTETMAKVEQLPSSVAVDCVNAEASIRLTSEMILHDQWSLAEASITEVYACMKSLFSLLQASHVYSELQSDMIRLDRVISNAANLTGSSIRPANADVLKEAVSEKTYNNIRAWMNGTPVVAVNGELYVADSEQLAEAIDIALRDVEFMLDKRDEADGDDEVDSDLEW